MEKFNVLKNLFCILVCSIIKILHDLSRDRRRPDRFLSIMDPNTFVRKDKSIIDKYRVSR